MTSRGLRPGARGLVAAVLIVIASLRIASTYRVFSDTADEANHVGAGLDLYQNHRYIVQDWNPPLPRVVLAAAPYLGGMRRDMSVDFQKQLQSVFASGKYERDLVLARVGNLVFFLLAALGVWFLARRVLDETQALIALALFTTQPVILGYSGLATHDTAAVAGTALGLLAFVRWRDEPSWQRAALFGVAYGFGALCKFSAPLFVAAGCVVLLLFRWRNPLQLVIAPVTAFATIAAGYAFHLAPFFHGMRGILAVDREGFVSFALGRYTEHGWWWYFPLTIALKTTLALLLLFVAGALFGNREWTLVTVAMILPALPSSLDLGIRYVLPVYVPFSIAVAAMCRRRILIGALLAWHLVASTLAHPDYFPYFNEIAAREPQRFLTDSNLDWGQDLLRLARYCRKHHVNALAYNLFSPSDPNRVGLPQRIDIDWAVPPKVPTALSESALTLTRAVMRHAYPWADHLPYVRIGKSIRLYNANFSFVTMEKRDAPQSLIARRQQTMNSTTLPTYALQSLAKGPSGESLYLNADNFGNVTVQFDKKSTSEWYPFSNQDGSIVFINVASEQVLTVKPDNSLTTSPLGQSPDNHNSWTFGGQAVRPQFNDDYNLNIRGDSYPAGTQVILYKWDGAANTRWTLVRA